jgi:pSer/pThr/pTyr-binding forkhead associated (FHA) protein
MTDSDLEKTAISSTLQDEKTQMASSPVGETTRLVAGIECPVCHTNNGPAETYCCDCGFLLSSQPTEIDGINQPRAAGKLVSRDGAREFSLRIGVNTVGRENADILLIDNTVSRRHATITVDESGAFVNDQGSTNGTIVDGARLEAGQARELIDGCEVVFGSAVLRYVAPELVIGHDVKNAENQAEEKAVEFEEPKPVIARLVAKDDSLRFELRKGSYSIGRRADSNDFVVPDPYCSGSHAELKCDEDGITIVDNGSTNGTFVNGVRLEPGEPKFVAAGDEITIGRVVFGIEV